VVVWGGQWKETSSDCIFTTLVVAPPHPNGHTLLPRRQIPLYIARHQPGVEPHLPRSTNLQSNGPVLELGGDAALGVQRISSNGLVPAFAW
jgi:hypothetical protein